MPCKVAGFVPHGNNAHELNINNYFSKAEQRSTSTATKYALIAAAEAIKQSQWVPLSDEDRFYSGIQLFIIDV